jgi:hypothetical protein
MSFRMGTTSFHFGRTMTGLNNDDRCKPVLPNITLHVEIEPTGDGPLGLVREAPAMTHETKEPRCFSSSSCCELRFNRGNNVLFCQPDWLDGGQRAMTPPGLQLLKLRSFHSDGWARPGEVRVDTVVFCLLVYPTGVPDESTRGNL